MAITGDLKKALDEEGLTPGITRPESDPATVDSGLARAVTSVFGPIPEDPFLGTRAGAMFTGATIGARIGMNVPGGPRVKALGAAAGIIGGTAMGALAPEAMEEGRSIITGEEPRPGLTFDEVMGETKRALLFEALFLGAGRGVRLVIKGNRAIFRKLAGVNASDRQFARRIRDKFGVNLNILTLSNRKFITAFPAVVGIFPILGTFLRISERQRLGELGRAASNMLAKFGGGPMDIPLAGPAAKRSAIRLYNSFLDAADKTYKLVNRQAVREGATVNPLLTRDKAAEVLRDIGRRTAITRGPGGKFKKAGGRSPITGLLDEALNLVDGQAPRQIDGFIEKLDLRITRLAASRDTANAKRLLDVRDALAQDSRTNLQGSKLLKQMMRDADNFFHRTSKTFESVLAKRFQKADRRTFKFGFEVPGSLNDDEIMKVLLNRNTSSPTIVDDLFRITDPKTFKRLAATHIDEGFRAARKVVDGDTQIFDVNLFTDFFDLSNKTSGRYLAMQRMFKLSGGNIDDLEQFSGILRRVLDTATPNARQFIVRRLTLGGGRAGARAFLPFASVAGGAAGAAGLLGGPIMSLAIGGIFTIGVRKMGKILSNPAALELFARAANTTLRETVRRTAVARFLGLLTRLRLSDDEREGINALIAETRKKLKTFAPQQGAPATLAGPF